MPNDAANVAQDAEPRDKNGLTEAEFLASYTPKKYPQPSLTADICVFRRHDGGLQLLLVQRGGHPYLGRWATPGGFCNPDETADACAARELEEETCVSGLKLEPIGLYSTPGRDPRGWTVSYAFVALDDAGSIPVAADDAARAAWFDVAATLVGPVSDGDSVTLALAHEGTTLTSEFTAREQPITHRLRAQDVKGDGLAFDHAQIVADAWLALQGL
ncbi:NUDIX hydrolase [Parafannyhessea umbonata]|jgi:8-oxo-dGTP diphosphatase|uniref:NUDIX hydrolase n=1 Tax=Parafannyhessea umbonata TaxID=604330 RepID=UPI0026F2B8C5|nr:NUDIX hydrolase [Parafannyhessea umbonata]MCI6681088.1 NUDIX hydrolase [Parafannyhessea umbonata]MCI7219512.1 NUDIX hydrolase [Parafannyhessea umbonata]MDD6601594.1 NUDIX hydrolase [Parafannyhessea umbonata]MDY4015336.1 NUDIX hydrolase [Parafannyhessea umbonata]